MKTQPVRCQWVTADPLYQSYHDKEWGRPVTDNKRLFEFLTLESAQAGLSWITILRKRENYRKAFAGFDPEKVARFSEEDVRRLMNDTGIVRNEKKIRAAITNARHFLEIFEEFDSFCLYSLTFFENGPLLNRFRHHSEVPSESDQSRWLSKDLKKRGFQFLGPTTVYSHLQASGLVNDHLVDCFCHKECENEMKSVFSL